MIRRSTWVVLVLLVALIGFGLYLTNRKAKEVAQGTATPGSSVLFSAAEGAATDIRIDTALGTSVEISRDQGGTWILKAPEQAAADQGAAEAAASQVSALRVLGLIQLAPDVVGLDKPSDTITITFSAGKTHKLLVGSVTPIQDGYYTQLDGGPYQIVDKVGLDALLNMLTQPPYLATPTPVASPTPSPVPPTVTPATTETPGSVPTSATTSPSAATVTPGGTGPAETATATSTP